MGPKRRHRLQWVMAGLQNAKSPPAPSGARGPRAFRWHHHNGRDHPSGSSPSSVPGSGRLSVGERGTGLPSRAWRCANRARAARLTASQSIIQASCSGVPVWPWKASSFITSCPVSDFERCRCSASVLGRGGVSAPDPRPNHDDRRRVEWLKAELTQSMALRPRTIRAASDMSGRLSGRLDAASRATDTTASDPAIRRPPAAGLLMSWRGARTFGPWSYRPALKMRMRRRGLRDIESAAMIFLTHSAAAFAASS